MNGDKEQLALMTPSTFELAQRMAGALSKSSIIPDIYRDNVPNCLIALEMANRMSASPMMVMQNLYIVHGKPAWSGQFIIAAINSTGKFSPLRFAFKGDGDKRECIAWATELATKERLEGPPVSIEMAKAEGWFQKNGSKWKTMPELMLRYRSATFFGRLYAPEVLMGMREESEVIDIDATVEPTITRAKIPKTLRDEARTGENPIVAEDQAAQQHGIASSSQDNLPVPASDQLTEIPQEGAVGGAGQDANSPGGQEPPKKKETPLKPKKKAVLSTEIPTLPRYQTEMLTLLVIGGYSTQQLTDVCWENEWIKPEEQWPLSEETLERLLRGDNKTTLMAELEALPK